MRDVYFDKSTHTTHLLKMPLSYLNSFTLLVNFIQRHLSCDVCGGIWHCFCNYLGLSEYITAVNCKRKTIKLEKMGRFSVSPPINIIQQPVEKKHDFEEITNEMNELALTDPDPVDEPDFNEPDLNTNLDIFSLD